MAASKLGFTLKDLYGFLRYHDKSLRFKGSIYDDVSSTLVSSGRSRMPDESAKAHCKRQVATIITYQKASISTTAKQLDAAKRKIRKERKKAKKLASLTNSQRPSQAIVTKIPKREPSNSVDFVVSNEFLKSYAWRQLRLVILKKQGRRCQCCGATPESGAIMNVDHIKPRKLFPELALEESNLQVLCGDCNHGKGNWDQTDFRDNKPTKS